MFEEKQIVWETELKSLKEKFIDYSIHHSEVKMRKSDYYNQILAESKTNNQFKASIVSGYSQSYNNEENEINMGNEKPDYLTLHHPDSASSKNSEIRQNLSRTAFNNFQA